MKKFLTKDMPHYLLTNEKVQIRGLKNHNVTMPFFVGRYSLMIMLICFIGLVSLFYLIVFSNGATRGYEIAKLENRRSELLTEKEQNNILLSESQTLDFVKNSSKVSGMRLPLEVSYYRPLGENGVAVAN